jgi:fructose/tagatose bisphosphate aldolase
VALPLVIHGGTGIASESYPGLAEAGVAKVNFGTGLKQAYLEAVHHRAAGYRRALSPHEFLGMGGPDDVMIAGRTAVKREVMRLITLCGSIGRCKGDHATECENAATRALQIR